MLNFSAIPEVPIAVSASAPGLSYFSLPASIGLANLLDSALLTWGSTPRSRAEVTLAANTEGSTTWSDADCTRSLFLTDRKDRSTTLSAACDLDDSLLSLPGDEPPVSAKVSTERISTLNGEIRTLTTTQEIGFHKDCDLRRQLVGEIAAMAKTPQQNLPSYLLFKGAVRSSVVQYKINTIFDIVSVWIVHGVSAEDKSQNFIRMILQTDKDHLELASDVKRCDFNFSVSSSSGSSTTSFFADQTNNYPAYHDFEAEGATLGSVFTPIGQPISAHVAFKCTFDSTDPVQLDAARRPLMDYLAGSFSLEIASLPEEAQKARI